MSSNNKNKIWLSVITAVISIAIFIVSMIIVYGSIITYIYSIDPNELLNGITYISLGCYFAAIYAYTDNIYYTIGIHMTTNTVASLLLLLK
jgi:membrane protease YdiL (CAAX protease family)